MRTRASQPAGVAVAGTEPPAGWGLWPGRGGGLLHYWFVQYNPLYFLSALGVLAGVALVSREIDAVFSAAAGGGGARGQATLFGVMQLYELLVVASAGFLARRAQAHRAAVLLALLESVFLLDCTFRLESVSQIGDLGVALAAVWVVLTPLKVAALGWGIGVRVPAMVLGLVTAAAAGLAAMLLALAAAALDATAVVVAAIWLGAIVVGTAVVLRPRLSWPRPLGPGEAAKLARTRRALLGVGAGFYYCHVVSYLLWAGDGVGRAGGPLAATAFLGVALLRRRESEIWLAGVLGVGFASVHAPSVPFTALVLGAVWLYRAHQLGRPRLAVGAVLALGAAGWASAGTAGPPVWVLAAVGIALAFVAWRRREPTALAALAAGAAWHLHAHGLTAPALLPGTRLGWGIVLLALGFIALTAGVLLSWRLRPPRAEADESEPHRADA